MSSFYEVAKWLIAALGWFGWLVRLFYMSWLGKIKTGHLTSVWKGMVYWPKDLGSTAPVWPPSHWVPPTCPARAIPSEAEIAGIFQTTRLGPVRGLLQLLATRHSHFQRLPYHPHTPLSLEKFLALNWSPLSAVNPLPSGPTFLFRGHPEPPSLTAKTAV